MQYEDKSSDNRKNVKTATKKKINVKKKKESNKQVT